MAAAAAAGRARGELRAAAERAAPERCRAPTRQGGAGSRRGRRQRRGRRRRAPGGVRQREAAKASPRRGQTAREARAAVLLRLCAALPVVAAGSGWGVLLGLLLV